MNLGGNLAETHNKPLFALGASNTIKCVLALQLLIRECAELWHTGDASGGSTRVTNDKPSTPIRAQVTPLLIP